MPPMHLMPRMRRTARRAGGLRSGKLLSTTRICFTLFCARTFGAYQHTVWNGEFEYARYRWRGHDWAVPTSAIEGDG